MSVYKVEKTEKISSGSEPWFRPLGLVGGTNLLRNTNTRRDVQTTKRNFLR